MLKALMPVAVFIVGCFFGTETFSVNALSNMVVVTTGVAIASYGEINLVWVGVFLQLLSVATESTRLTLVGFGSRSDGAASQRVKSWLFAAGAFGAAGPDPVAKAGPELEPNHHNVLHSPSFLPVPMCPLGNHRGQAIICR